MKYWEESLGWRATGEGSDSLTFLFFFFFFLRIQRFQTLNGRRGLLTCRIYGDRDAQVRARQGLRRFQSRGEGIHIEYTTHYTMPSNDYVLLIFEHSTLRLLLNSAISFHDSFESRCAVSHSQQDI